VKEDHGREGKRLKEENGGEKEPKSINNEKRRLLAAEKRPGRSSQKKAILFWGEFQRGRDRCVGGKGTGMGKDLSERNCNDNTNFPVWKQ